MRFLTLQGGLPARTRRAGISRLTQLSQGTPRLILATGRFVGEGFDAPRLDTQFLALPVSWRGTLIQYAGRLQRLHPGKQEVRVDYVDRAVPVLARMFDRRSRGYRAIGYAAAPAVPHGQAAALLPA